MLRAIKLANQTLTLAKVGWFQPANFLRSLSMAIGTLLTQTYWDDATKTARSQLVAGIGIYGHAPLPDNLPLFSRMADSQAAMIATNNFYADATILNLLFAGLVWFAKRPKGPLQQAAHG